MRYSPGDIAKAIECLPSKHETLSSNPSTTKNSETKLKLLRYRMNFIASVNLIQAKRIKLNPRFRHSCYIPLLATGLLIFVCSSQEAKFPSSRKTGDLFCLDPRTAAETPEVTILFSVSLPLTNPSRARDWQSGRQQRTRSLGNFSGKMGGNRSEVKS
jgi:hypothetical protein